MKKPRLRRAPFAFLTLLALACATAAPPTDAITAGEKSISEATQADAEPYARLELHLAREHVTQARAAMEAERYEEARELAEKAMVEAELAEAKANSARALPHIGAPFRTDLGALHPRRFLARSQGRMRPGPH